MCPMPLMIPKRVIGIYFGGVVSKTWRK